MNKYDLFDLTWSGWKSQCLFSAIDIGIFEALMINPMTSDEIAEKIKIEKETVKIILIGLESLNLIRKDNKYWSLTSESKDYLCSNSSKNILSLISHMNFVNKTMNNLTEVLKTNEPNLHSSHDLNLYDYLSGYPKISEDFSWSLTPSKKEISILDIGGGLGFGFNAFLKKYPNCNYYLLDKPDVINLYKQVNKRRNPQISLINGDFFETKFKRKFDIIFMSQFLHGQPKMERNIAFLKCNRLLKKNGTLIIREQISDYSEYGALFNLNLIACKKNASSLTFKEISDYASNGKFNIMKIVLENKYFQLIFCKKRKNDNNS